MRNLSRPSDAISSSYVKQFKKRLRPGKSLDEIKKTIDLLWYKDWAGVSVRDRVENIEHVYKGLTTKT